jgi:hypothetical protein
LRQVIRMCLTERYTTDLAYFVKYLKAGMRPHDFSHMLDDYYENPPEGFDADEPY